jgi:hypothetical protein
MNDKTKDAILVAINSCKDVTTLGRFAPTVDPVRWVEQLQAHLEGALKSSPNPVRRQQIKKRRKRGVKSSVPNISIGDYS